MFQFVQMFDHIQRYLIITVIVKCTKILHSTYRVQSCDVAQFCLLEKDVLNYFRMLNIVACNLVSIVSTCISISSVILLSEKRSKAR